MKKIFILSAIALVVASCSYKLGYAHNNETTDNRDIIARNEPLRSFSGINTYLPYDVKVMQGDQSSISIKGPAKYVNNILIDVKGGKLYLTQKERHISIFNFGFNNAPEVTIVITTPSLVSYEIYGSGDADINMGRQSDLYLKISGSGDIALNNFACGSFRADIGGSGDMNCKSLNCETIEANIAGSGDLECKNIECKTIEANVSGSGDISFAGKADSGKFHVSGSGDISSDNLFLKRLDASVSGSGDISCNAVDVNKYVSGSGDFTNRYRE